MTAVIAAQELADVGEVVIELADIVGVWGRPSFDVAASTVGVFDGDALVAYAEHTGGDRADAAVHPAYRRRGLGTTLAAWLRAKARAAGAIEVGMPVPAGSPGEALARSLGYRQRWESWVLELPAGAEIADQPLPQGFSVREARPDELDQAYQVVEDAFLEWSVRPRQSLDDWASEIVGRPGFAPWNLRVALGPDGRVVGACHVLIGEGACGYVAKLAVRRDLRNRGLARGLLADAFTVARAHGATRSELSTDSRTGALGLYERLGMVVTSRWVNLAADLR